MKKYLLLILFFSTYIRISAQCSICTKTAQQLGEGPASSLNTGIVYLMLVPFVIMGILGYKWWKNEKNNMLNNPS